MHPLHLSGGSHLFRTGLLHLLQPHYYVSEGEGGLHIVILARSKNCRRTVDKLIGEVPKQTLIIGEPLELKFLKHCLKQGLGGYLLYTVSADNLVAAAAAVQRDRHYVDPDLRNYWIDVQLNADRPLPTTFAIKLTRREKEVLQLIVEEFTTDEIGRRLFIATSTVESHRANILAKLGVRNVAGLVREAIRRQLCVVG